MADGYSCLADIIKENTQYLKLVFDKVERTQHEMDSVGALVPDWRFDLKSFFEFTRKESFLFHTNFHTKKVESFNEKLDDLLLDDLSEEHIFLEGFTKLIQVKIFIVDIETFDCTVYGNIAPLNYYHFNTSYEKEKPLKNFSDMNCRQINEGTTPWIFFKKRDKIAQTDAYLQVDVQTFWEIHHGFFEGDTFMSKTNEYSVFYNKNAHIQNTKLICILNQLQFLRLKTFELEEIPFYLNRKLTGSRFVSSPIDSPACQKSKRTLEEWRVHPIIDKNDKIPRAVILALRDYSKGFIESITEISSFVCQIGEFPGGC